MANERKKTILTYTTEGKGTEIFDKAKSLLEERKGYRISKVGVLREAVARLATIERLLGEGYTIKFTKDGEKETDVVFL